jgi:hypothetical protein
MSERAAQPIMAKGKYNEALVYAKALEYTCEHKIRQRLDHPAFADTAVRIMPEIFRLTNTGRR